MVMEVVKVEGIREWVHLFKGLEASQKIFAECLLCAR